MLHAGYARVDITPPLGILITGYYEPRVAKGTYDPLFATAFAFSDGEHRAVLISLDVLGIRQRLLDGMRARIGEHCGLPREAVFVTCTHTHTGPEICDDMFEPDPIYNERLEKLIEQAAQTALDDLRPATLLSARGSVPGLSFLRRFRMKDGTVRTNPGWRNPDIAEAIGRDDPSFQLVRIVREGAPELLLVNYQVHPDTIGDFMGSVEYFSADYPGYLRSALEGALPGTRVLFLNGACGNLNHIDVHCPEWDSNCGLTQTAHMGRALAGEALRVYTKAQPLAGDRVDAAEYPLIVDANKGAPEQIPLAQSYARWHREGRDDLIPETGMGITTLVAESFRILAMADAPERFTLNITALRVGDLCIGGIPGEAFTEIGLAVKARSPFPMQMIAGISNGYEGYFPLRDAYAEGGYEARSAFFQAGAAEAIGQSLEEVVARLYQTTP